MTQIHKFSLVYDATEDRLAWDAEDIQGATTRLWLTQKALPRVGEGAASDGAGGHASKNRAPE
jgi:hypothetical protein